jgi:hypothetical protein
MYTSVALSNRSVFRYLRYLSPPNGSCNVSEIQFYGVATNRPSVSAHLTPTNTMAVSWLVTHTGWRLQIQPLGGGISNAWSEVSGSVTNNDLQIPQISASPGALFRLVYP